MASNGYEEDVTAALRQIQSAEGSRGINNYIILISLRECSQRREAVALQRETHKNLTNLILNNEMQSMEDVYEDEDETTSPNKATRLFKISDWDFALYIASNEYRIIGFVNDVKLSILRLVERYLPDVFDRLNQWRLVQVFDLSRHKHIAVKRLRKLAESKQPEGELEQGPTDDERSDLTQNVEKYANQKLSSKHIELVNLTFERLGSSMFRDIFIRSQEIALVVPNKGAEPVINEMFVSVAQIRKHLLVNVDMSDGRNYFYQLTQLLDRLVLRCICEVRNVIRFNTSFNLNIDSVFTPEFQQFEETLLDRLPNCSVEFRAADIFDNFDRFDMVRDLIAARGASIAIDSVHPKMIGVLDFHRMGVRMAKINWTPEAEEILSDRAAEITRMQRAGVVFILARVEDPVGVRLGQKLGIRLFQGFHIDEMLLQIRYPSNLNFWRRVLEYRSRMEDFQNEAKINGRITDKRKLREMEHLITTFKTELEGVQAETSSLEELKTLLHLRSRIDAMEAELLQGATEGAAGGGDARANQVVH